MCVLQVCRYRLHCTVDHGPTYRSTHATRVTTVPNIQTAHHRSVKNRRSRTEVGSRTYSFPRTPPGPGFIIITIMYGSYAFIYGSSRYSELGRLSAGPGAARVGRDVGAKFQVIVLDEHERMSACGHLPFRLLASDFLCVLPPRRVHATCVVDVLLPPTESSAKGARERRKKTRTQLVAHGINRSCRQHTSFDDAGLR